MESLSEVLTASIDSSLEIEKELCQEIVQFYDDFREEDFELFCDVLKSWIKEKVPNIQPKARRHLSRRLILSLAQQKGWTLTDEIKLPETWIEFLERSAYMLTNEEIRAYEEKISLFLKNNSS